ncbi:hypothetical protein HN709_05160 [Candidatus Peregrinibacteria bacterium]|jgi:hypothetical protein|nr:hypothetical protein [Candidatus Peregrinibacteria bacterium]MBT7737050.1 hypothetical protein [Candidatus Peregrinibacteria bacterium]
MEKASKYFAGTALAIFAVTLGAVTAFADSTELARPQLSEGEREAMHEDMKEFHDEVQEVLLSGDYDAWYGLVSSHEGPRSENVLEVINEDNFDEFVEAHELMEEAKEIMEELGLEGPEGMGKHKMGAMKGGHGQRGMGPQLQE